MDIKKIGAKVVKDSRGEKTILVSVRTGKGNFITSSPSGKSTGKYEVKCYKESLNGDIKFINNLDVEKINKLNLQKFKDLEHIEKIVKNKIGGNSLFALEASLLKAIAKENRKELWKFLGGEKVNLRPVGNAIGGGLHSKGVKGKKPDFQEFLFIANGRNFYENVWLNETAYNFVKTFLGFWNKRNDEGAWETGETNKGVLEIMNRVKKIIKDKYNRDIDVGLDIAASSFYENKKYNYSDSCCKLNPKEQVDYVAELINKYNLFYIEDALDEDDFSGFKKLRKKVKRNVLIVGDDLTVTNPERLKKAIKMKSINAIIVKPNQIGSLLKVKEVIKIAKKNRIKTIISHRSGETKDDTIADLAMGFKCDFIKTGIYGNVRKTKLKRLTKIKKGLR